MRKKGDFMLGEFGVKLVVGILCIVMLVLIAVYVSKLFAEQSRKKQAEATLNEIILKLEYLKKSASNEISYDLRSPQGWFIFSGQSQGKFYLCICPRDSYDSCKEGICKETASLININEETLLHKEIASERAEILKISKETKENKEVFSLSK